MRDADGRVADKRVACAQRRNAVRDTPAIVMEYRMMG